jgi:hypothetical protein
MAHTSFKDRNLLAVIGDEVRTPKSLPLKPPVELSVGFNNRSSTGGYRSFERTTEEEFSSGRPE